MKRLLARRTVLPCLGVGLTLIPALLASLLPAAVSGGGADDLAQTYAKQIHPLFVKMCGNCHGQKPKNNDLDLTSFGTAKAILAKPKVLADVAERLIAGDMPPKGAPQPSKAEREQLMGWIKAALDA